MQGSLFSAVSLLFFILTLQFPTAFSRDPLSEKGDDEWYLAFTAFMNYYGEWTPLNPVDTQPPLQNFTSTRGIAFVDDEKLVLIDGVDIYKKSVISLRLDRFDVFSRKRLENDVARIQGQKIRYQIGKDISDLQYKRYEECIMDELTLTTETHMAFDSERDYKNQAVIQIKVVGGDCPFSFEINSLQKLRSSSLKLFSPYLRVAIETSYHGEWPADLSLTDNKSKLAKFENRNGIIKHSLNYDKILLTLLDGESLEGNKLDIMFYALGGTDPDTSIIRKQHHLVQYRLNGEFYQECVAKEVLIIIMNKNTGKNFDAGQDKVEDAAIQIKFTGGECAVNFETTLLLSYEDKLWLQDWTFFSLGAIWWGLLVITTIKGLQKKRYDDLFLGAQSLILIFVYFYIWEAYLFFSFDFLGVLGPLTYSLLNLPILYIQIFTVTYYLSKRPPPDIEFFAEGQARTKLASIIVFGLAIAKAIMYFIFESTPTLALVELTIIPMVDIVRNLKKKARPDYNLLLYFGNLLSSFVVFAYNILYYKAFLGSWYSHTRFMYYSIVFILITYVILPIQVRMKRIKYFEGRKISLQNEQECPICMQLLVPTKTNDENDAIVEPTDNQNIQLNSLSNGERKLIKTECGHVFHENCLKDWLRMKAECPFCREPIIDPL